MGLFCTDVAPWQPGFSVKPKLWRRLRKALPMSKGQIGNSVLYHSLPVLGKFARDF
jgi:hypothetical protein